MWDNWKNTLHNWKSLHEKVDQLHKLGGLRIWILHVLSHGPKNGVEIMDSIQEHYEGMYRIKNHFANSTHTDKHYNMHLRKTMNRTASRPSPGSVYPMLKKMVSEGLINKKDDGRYELTKNGHIVTTNLFEHFQSPKNGDPLPISMKNSLTAINWHVSYMEDIDKENIAKYKESIESLIERLEKLKKSIK
jgi:DNA-binding PadR family transcriptional regulator